MSLPFSVSSMSNDTGSASSTTNSGEILGSTLSDPGRHLFGFYFLLHFGGLQNISVLLYIFRAFFLTKETGVESVLFLSSLTPSMSERIFVKCQVELSCYSNDICFLLFPISSEVEIALFHFFTLT